MKGLLVWNCHSCAGFNPSRPWDGLAHKAGSHQDHLILKLLDRAGFVYCPMGRIASKCGAAALVNSSRLVLQMVALRAAPLGKICSVKTRAGLEFFSGRLNPVLGLFRPFRGLISKAPRLPRFRLRFAVRTSSRPGYSTARQAQSLEDPILCLDNVRGSGPSRKS